MTGGQTSVRLSVLRVQAQQVTPPECPSYLVDILRYSVHLLGPGHPGWRVGHNHTLKFLQMRPGLVPLDGAAEPRLLSAVNELVCSWFPSFYRKVLRSAHTGVAPHAAAPSAPPV